MIATLGNGLVLEESRRRAAGNRNACRTPTMGERIRALADANQVQGA